MQIGPYVSDNIVQLWEGILKLLKKNFICTLVCAFGLVLYSQLMTQQLVNAYDGLWEYTYHSAGKWELSLGRWFWLYLDRFHFGINNDPWTSILTIMLFSIGMCVILDIFCLEDKKISFLISALFISSTAVCVSLSYRYMSPIFGFAFLLSVLAVWVIIKMDKIVLPVIQGSFMVALSMGAYQAYLGCTCLVIVGYLLWKLYCTDVQWKQLAIYMGKSAAMVLTGGILYVLLLKVHLIIFHTSLSNYNGADTYSFWNSIKKLPVSIKNAYSIFTMYFFKDLYRVNMLQSYKIYMVPFILAAVIIVIGFIQIWCRCRIRAICFLALMILLPVAANAVVLIATDTGVAIQMTAPLALTIPVFICLASKVVSNINLPLLIQVVGGAVALVVLWGNIYQVQVDQNAMYEGKVAASTMAEEILNELAEEKCLDTDLRYCFIGIPAGNRLFYVSEAYAYANNYAMIGVGWTDSDSSMKSWRGIFRYFCGVNINIWSTNSCEVEIAEADIDNMPVYPMKGYIKQVGDVVVIKVN